MATINKDTRIYVAGHRGLVGSAIWHILEAKGYRHLIGRTHAELDLMDPAAVKAFFDEERPEAVILAAAHVGGIMANSLYRADFIYQNLQIQQNVIGEAWRHGVQKLLFLGSSCIYPREAPQPINEDALLTSPLEYTNEPYAIAKIAGMKMCESFNLQYGTDYLAVMPTNLYGPGDNFHLENSHVLPAMIRKMHLARLLNVGDLGAIRADLAAMPPKDYETACDDRQLTSILAHHGIYPDRLELWGTGRVLREFLWSRDMADACVHILENVTFAQLVGDDPQPRNTHINIGTGIELTIAQLAEKVRQAVGYQGRICWDASKPDGTPRKLCDVGRLHSLGWRHTVDLDQGIPLLYDWYRTGKAVRNH